ncbi:MAG: hypothetical protein JSR96_08605 [Proteobacteria bacterium]|nr:hypothetical protein [Pseudomonadota bacterium]
MKWLAASALLFAASAVAAAGGGTRTNDDAIVGDGFAPVLSAYGFFSDAQAQRPAAGVTPYRLQTPLWSDGAEKQRFVYVPGGKQARSRGAGLLDLPVGSALIKSFRFGGRLIETRVLLHRAGGWIALPYLWNADQSEARLVLAGARVDLTTPAGAAISYAVPNKNQCKECHGAAGQVVPIGPKARNLSAEWLAAFKRAGKLDAVPAVARRVPLWEDRAAVPVADAARGYLDANCAHCHNPDGAASNSGLTLTWEETDPVKLGVGKRPVAAGRGSGDLQFDVVPGDPDHSILAYRMASLEGGISMPELGRASLDPAGQAIIRGWIAGMR